MSKNCAPPSFLPLYTNSTFKCTVNYELQTKFEPLFCLKKLWLVINLFNTHIDVKIFFSIRN